MCISCPGCGCTLCISQRAAKQSRGPTLFAFTLMLQHALRSAPMGPQGCCTIPAPPRSPSLCPYPLGQLRVHHEVVNMLLSFGELQLSGHHSHHQGCAAGALQGQQDGGTGGSHSAWSGVGCVGVTGSVMGGWRELWGRGSGWGSPAAPLFPPRGSRNHMQTPITGCTARPSSPHPQVAQTPPS